MSILNLKHRAFLLLLIVILGGSYLPPMRSINAAPATDHPRLWVRSSDLPRLRSWAVDSNPVYRDGLAALVVRAVHDMDSGNVPAKDTGSPSYEEFPTEMYAQLFAFLSLIDNDPLKRADYAARARKLLMFVMNQAVRGVADGQPFREPDFALSDRSRWYGSAFGLTVDWIYPSLSAQDKATIRTVFLRWIDELTNAGTTSNNHPEPIGVVNSPDLVSDPLKVRWAGNNYYNAHMRNMGLMALSFDAADDPGGKLIAALKEATGAWLYVVDHLQRTDARGGFSPEGFEYGPQAMGYAAQFLLALYTSGNDDPQRWGSQVIFKDNPFWDDSIPAYLHSLSPATVTNPDVGQVYQPAGYGAVQDYYAPDFILQFGPMGIYDSDTGNTKRLETLRWIELNSAPGGTAGLSSRVADTNFFDRDLLYFLLLDPTAPAPADPRPALPTTLYAPGLRRLLARTDWGTGASFFTYALSWDTVDHQSANGNTIEFYRKGEWLTKQRVGYDLDYGSSDNLNTIALQNDKPALDASDYRTMLWERGSQWLYVPSGDPPPPLITIDDRFIYAQGDATNLYNSTTESANDILLASRSVIWLKPDHIIVYDRTQSKTAGRFKRFWLNFPTQATVSGKLTTMQSPAKQQLFVTTVLPVDAALSIQPAPNEPSGLPANGEPMKFQLKVEAPGGPTEVQFLNVLQGADAGATPDPVQQVASTAGTPFTGVLVRNTLVLFAVNLDKPFVSLTYQTPITAATQIITGLPPSAAFNIDRQRTGDTLKVNITPGTAVKSDAGGVLVIAAQY